RNEKMGRRIAAMLVLLALRAPAARALEVDPDTEIAQQLIAEGAAAYDAHDYPRALARFEAARHMKPLAAFDYNIARCHDRLGHAAEAVAAYERYVAQKPDAPDSVEVRERIAVLRARLAPPVVVGVPAATAEGGARSS